MQKKKKKQDASKNVPVMVKLEQVYHFGGIQTFTMVMCINMLS